MSFSVAQSGTAHCFVDYFYSASTKKPRTVKSRRGLKFVITNSITANQKEKEIYSAIDIQLSTP